MDAKGGEDSTLVRTFAMLMDRLGSVEDRLTELYARKKRKRECTTLDVCPVRTNASTTSLRNGVITVRLSRPKQLLHLLRNVEFGAAFEVLWRDHFPGEDHATGGELSVHHLTCPQCFGIVHKAMEAVLHLPESVRLLPIRDGNTLGFSVGYVAESSPPVDPMVLLRSLVPTLRGMGVDLERTTGRVIVEHGDIPMLEFGRVMDLMHDGSSMSLVVLEYERCLRDIEYPDDVMEHCMRSVAGSRTGGLLQEACSTILRDVYNS
jgi:hypothetical protein